MNNGVAATQTKDAKLVSMPKVIIEIFTSSRSGSGKTLFALSTFLYHYLKRKDQLIALDLNFSNPDFYRIIKGSLENTIQLSGLSPTSSRQVEVRFAKKLHGYLLIPWEEPSVILAEMAENLSMLSFERVWFFLNGLFEVIKSGQLSENITFPNVIENEKEKGKDDLYLDPDALNFEKKVKENIRVIIDTGFNLTSFLLGIEAHLRKFKDIVQHYPFEIEFKFWHIWHYSKGITLSHLTRWQAHPITEVSSAFNETDVLKTLIKELKIDQSIIHVFTPRSFPIHRGILDFLRRKQPEVISLLKQNALSVSSGSTTAQNLEEFTSTHAVQATDGELLFVKTSELTQLLNDIFSTLARTNAYYMLNKDEIQHFIFSKVLAFIQDHFGIISNMVVVPNLYVSHQRLNDLLCYFSWYRSDINLKDIHQQMSDLINFISAYYKKTEE